MTPAADAHDAYAAFREPGYRLMLGGAVLASTGLEMQATAIGWEILERTDSALVIGYTGLAQFLPVLLLVLPAGQLVDRHDRKRLFQLAQAVMACASLGLAYLSYTRGPVDLMLACLVLSGCGRALSAPARVSLYPQLVPASALPNAVAWNSTGWQVASVSGPALAGLLIYLAPYWVAYAVAAGGALACILLLTPVRPRASVGRPLNRSFASMAAGVRFVWNTKLLLSAITLDLFAVLLGGATALLPIFARDILHVGKLGLGFLRASPAVGALCMALVMAHRPPLRRPGAALLLAVAGFGLATIGFGLSENLILSFAMLFLTGALDNVSVVVRGTLMQMLTPDDMRGRVSSVNSLFISSSNELGVFESGATAAAFGPIKSVVGGGIGTLAVVALVWWRWPQLAAVGELHRLGEERREVGDELYATIRQPAPTTIPRSETPDDRVGPDPPR